MILIVNRTVEGTEVRRAVDGDVRGNANANKVTIKKGSSVRPNRPMTLPLFVERAALRSVTQDQLRKLNSKANG